MRIKRRHFNPFFQPIIPRCITYPYLIFFQLVVARGMLFCIWSKIWFFNPFVSWLCIEIAHIILDCGEGRTRTRISLQPILYSPFSGLINLQGNEPLQINLYKASTNFATSPFCQALRRPGLPWCGLRTGMATSQIFGIPKALLKLIPVIHAVPGETPLVLTQCLILSRGIR